MIEALWAFIEANVEQHKTTFDEISLRDFTDIYIASTKDQGGYGKISSKCACPVIFIIIIVTVTVLVVTVVITFIPMFAPWTLLSEGSCSYDIRSIRQTSGAQRPQCRSWRWPPWSVWYVVCSRGWRVSYDSWHVCRGYRDYQHYPTLAIHLPHVQHDTTGQM